MAVKSKSKRARKSRPHSIHKPRGVIHPRVRAVGPEHFAFICVDCAKNRSKMMVADFYGRVLIEPTVIEHDRSGFEAALRLVRDALKRHGIKDQIAVIERTGATTARSSAPSPKRGSKSASSIPTPPNNIASPPIRVRKPTTPTSLQSSALRSMASDCWSTNPIRFTSASNSWRDTVAGWCIRMSCSGSRCSNICTLICQDIHPASRISLIPSSSSGWPST